MALVRRLGLLALTLLASSCILMQGPNDAGTTIVYVPIPVPVGPIDAGKPPPRIRGTDFLWIIRVERSTANIAEAIDGLVSQTTAEAQKNGLIVRNVVAATQAGQLIWATGPNIPTTRSLGEVLRTAATMPPVPATCTTNPLFALGANLGSRSVFPPGGGESDPGVVTPFTEHPSAMVIGIIDTGPRPVAPADPACQWHGLPPEMAFTTTGDPVPWLSFPDGSLPMANVKLFFVATAEAVDDPAFLSACRGVEGLPDGALDALSPSPTKFFDPLTSGINGRHAGLASRFDVCRALGRDGAKNMAATLTAWIPTANAPDAP